MNNSNDFKIDWLTTISQSAKKRSNTQIVLDTLEKAMLKKDLLPGQLLPSETAMATSLNMGKSSIREAIKMLEGIGVIKVVHGKGSYITNDFKDTGSNLLAFQLILAENSPEELIEFRYLFELLYMQLAMTKITDTDLASLKKNIDSFKKKIENNTQEVEDDKEFHEKILKICDNSIIISIGKIINKMLLYSFTKAVQKYPSNVYKDHLMIYNALKEKNSEKLEKAVMVNLDRWAKHFKK